MFRWYGDAARYLYLSDVLIPCHEHSSEQLEPAWGPAFRASQWFTRGWTLQELLAPAVVEFFFTKEGRRLGDKKCLEKQIHGITGSQFQRYEELHLLSRSRRAIEMGRNTQTTREEDWAYCLLGIFGIHIPLIGEGRKNAICRLRKELAEAGKLPTQTNNASFLQLGSVFAAGAFGGGVGSALATIFASKSRQGRKCRGDSGGEEMIETHTARPMQVGERSLN